VNPGTPVITNVNPSSGQQGQISLPMTITGNFTHFSSASVVTFSGVTGTSAASALITNDTLDWSAAGPNGSFPSSPFNVSSSVNQLNVTVATPTPNAGFELFIPGYQPTFWNFPAGENGLHISEGTIRLTFATPVSAVGFDLSVNKINAPGPFTASLSTYNGT